MVVVAVCLERVSTQNSLQDGQIQGISPVYRYYDEKPGPFAV